MQPLRIKIQQIVKDNTKILCGSPKETLPTFAMCFCFNDLTDASRTHCILCREGELVPGATFKIFKAIRAFTGTDGKVTPLLAVILRVLQNVA